VDAPAAPPATAAASGVRVRFAPSPTGNLHVGGARTALFNWLYARRHGGTFVLRVEDTDAARSTRESEVAMLEDLKWLGLTWDEGPDVGGPHGPYRQSERKELYKSYVDQLVAAGKAYPCFCTDAELDAQRADAEARSLPPVYRGKWAAASAEEVAAELAAGTPHCYRFRVPPGETVTIQDEVRGEVSWSTDTLGDFVVLRSNGLPVYNFCVAVDDALMRITHVIRAEEHLPNTLRQVLIYEALGFPRPSFAHVSLILAPDRSKLSKRHGATSVGEFKGQGFLAPAMVNFLSLLGWNDGTEQEIFEVRELAEKFSLDRITKSAAVFDNAKLSWMNGQHLRALPEAELVAAVGARLAAGGLIGGAGSPLAGAAVALLRDSLELVADAEARLRELLAFPLAEALASEAGAAVVEDGFGEVAAAIVAAADAGEFPAAGGDAFKAWLKALGKATARKGKRLFMPARVALTGRAHGPEVAEVLALLDAARGEVAEAGALVPLEGRIDALRAWLAANAAEA
jgi:glutamyl-tRNA synthetase